MQYERRKRQLPTLTLRECDGSAKPSPSRLRRTGKSSSTKCRGAVREAETTPTKGVFVFLRVCARNSVIGVARWLLGQGHRLTLDVMGCRSVRAACTNSEVRAGPLNGSVKVGCGRSRTGLRRRRCWCRTEQQVCRSGGDLTDLLNRRRLGIGRDEVDDIDQGSM